MPTLRKILRKLVVALVGVVLLFEEWGWEPLAAVFARLTRLPLWAWLELKITKLPPGTAVLLFVLPILALLPVKLLALYLLGKGQSSLGLVLLLAAKLVGTAVTARLFHLTQPALMQLRWFASGYVRWKAWKDTLMAELRNSAVWRAGVEIKQRARDWLRHAQH